MTLFAAWRLHRRCGAKPPAGLRAFRMAGARAPHVAISRGSRARCHLALRALRADEKRDAQRSSEPAGLQSALHEPRAESMAARPGRQLLSTVVVRRHQRATLQAWPGAKFRHKVWQGLATVACPQCQTQRFATQPYQAPPAIQRGQCGAVVAPVPFGMTAAALAA